MLLGSPNGFVLIQHLYVVLLTLFDEGKKLRRTVLCGKRNFSVYVNNIGILYRYSNEMTYMKDKPNGAGDINLIILELPLERQVVALAVVVFEDGEGDMPATDMKSSSRGSSIRRKPLRSSSRNTVTEGV